MTIERLNDHPIIDELEGQWEKLFLILMWKQGLREVRVTPGEIEEFSKAFGSTGPAMVCEGLGPTGNEIISIRLVSMDEARKLARGRA